MMTQHAESQWKAQSQAENGISGFRFTLPSSLHAAVPPERRGVRRDRVRLMVLHRQTDQLEHTRFHHLSQWLNPGDLLVLNTSRTVPAVLQAIIRKEEAGMAKTTEVRLARKIDERTWEALLVEKNVAPGALLIFTRLLTAEIKESDTPSFVKLVFSLSGAALYNEIYAIGEPIRYEYITTPWPLDYYQTVFASEPGSVEMPSAGRALTWELLFKLRNRGIGIAFLQLHTGLSYLLDDSVSHSPADHPETYAIPQETAEAIRSTKERGGRVIAVGTTVVRALESAAFEDGHVAPGAACTNLYITSEHRLRVANGLITGFHEPEASHLELLSAFVSKDILLDAYQEALREGYYWHEFGDMNLIV